MNVTLVLDWAHQKWLDDDSIEIDEAFMQKSTLLIMSKDNSLKDCKEVEDGSAQDSELIQDYKKSNQHLDKPKVNICFIKTPRAYFKKIIKPLTISDK